MELAPISSEAFAQTAEQSCRNARKILANTKGFRYPLSAILTKSEPIDRSHCFRAMRQRLGAHQKIGHAVGLAKSGFRSTAFLAAGLIPFATYVPENDDRR